jgi:hypothetical protein
LVLARFISAGYRLDYSLSCIGCFCLLETLSDGFCKLRIQISIISPSFERLATVVSEESTADQHVCDGSASVYPMKLRIILRVN